MCGTFQMSILMWTQLNLYDACRRERWVGAPRSCDSTCAMGARDRGKAAFRPSRSSSLFLSVHFWVGITVSFATGWIGCFLWLLFGA